MLQPVGGLQGAHQSRAIGINGQMSQASQYAPLVIKVGNGAILRLSDIASVVNGTANTRLAAWNGKQPAILLSISKEAGANAIETADRIHDLLPLLMTWLPPDIQLSVMTDRTITIRASVVDVQYTLLVTIALVLLVVLIFMRRLVPTVAAAVTVPLSISGTLAGMWFIGYTIDNFSLMALTVSVGFVVDDAIVMIENIVRHVDRGMPPLQAAIVGGRQIGFTVLSISISLVAVFIPLIFMGGLLGRLFHEFAMTLTMAIAVSAAVSLSLTPMICGRYMRSADKAAMPGAFWGAIDRALGRFLNAVERYYFRSLDWALAHRTFMLLVTLLTVVLTIRMYGLVPKGFMPEQDIGIIQGSTVADTDVSYQTMTVRQRQVVDVLLTDPAIASISSNVGVGAGWDTVNRGWVSIGLKPRNQRGVSSDEVIDRLREKLARLQGIQTSLYSAQELRMGGRQGGSQYQYVLITHELAAMRYWALALEEKLKQTPGIVDVTSDQDRAGPQVNLVIDRDASARLGVNTTDIDNVLNNAYAQRQISTIYAPRNQYKVGTGSRSQAATGPVIARPAVCRCRRWGTDPALRRHPFRAWLGAAGSPPSGTVSRRHDQLQPRPRHRARHRRGCGSGGIGRVANARRRAYGICRQREVPAAVSVDSAAADQCRADIDLYRPGRALRELAASADDHFHPAFRGTWGIIGALADRDRPFRDGDHRHHPADGHRQEERHHDGGFCLGGGARTGPVAIRSDPRRLSAAVPSDHHDDTGGTVRRDAARAGVRHRV